MRAVKVLAAVTAVALVGGSGLVAWIRLKPFPKVVIGRVPLDRPVALVVDDYPPRREPPPPPPPPAAAAPARGGVPGFSAPRTRGLWPPNGRPPGPARPFSEPVDDSGGLQFVLVLGSDARAGNPERARADSIHVLALDPKARRGTVLGIPRDSYVDVPGVGRRKINDALASGGPELAVRTVRNLTGMPITWYALTAFQGFMALVDEAGGLDAHVPYDMSDAASGAYFQAGWHRMQGGHALAFSRNRHIPAGDFARSENQGRLMLDALRNVRATTGTRGEIEALVRVLVKHVRVDAPLHEVIRLALLARTTDPSRVRNVVAPGRTGSAGGASVVFLTEQAQALFRDIADDAWVDGSYPLFGPGSGGDGGAGGQPAPAQPAPSQPPPPEPSPEPSPTPAPLPSLPLP